MTNKEIIDSAILLAGSFYEMLGCTHRPGFRYWESTHPQEVGVWRMAELAYEKIQGTELDDILDQYLDELDES